MRMAQRFPIYMGDVPDYEVKGDHMHIVWRDLEIVLPVSVMLAGMAGAKRAIAEWQQDHSGEVVQLGKH
jgi:hypothetical protein